MKTILLTILIAGFSFSAQAAIKLSPAEVTQIGPFYQIIYTLNGAQQVANVTASGGVTSDATILWDERTQGPIPQGVDPLTASLVGGVLVADATKISAAQAAATAAATAANQEANAKTAYVTIKAKLAAGTATSAEIQAALFFLIRHVGP